MFRNIGEKIKGLAMVITVAGILASICAGIVLLTMNQIRLAIIVACVGSLISWISSFLLYGFGQLVDNSDRIVDFIYAYSEYCETENFEKNNENK